MENKNPNPFSGELKGKLLKENIFGKNFVPKFELDADGIYTFSLKNKEDFIFSKVPLATLTATPELIDGKNYLSVYETKVNKDFKNKGIATNIYRYIMEHLPEGFDGIYSPSESRANDIIIPKIYEKLSKEYSLIKDPKDDYFLTKK